jgi:hypothetical protein
MVFSEAHVSAGVGKRLDEIIPSHWVKANQTNPTATIKRM